MTLIFCDGFDHYSTTDLNDDTKWTTTFATPAVGGSFARHGGGGLECVGSSDGVRIEFPDSPSISSSEFNSIIVGFAHKQTSANGNGSTFLRIGGAGSDSSYIQLRHSTTIGTRLYTDNDLRASSLINDTDDDWHFYEVKATINPTSGSGSVIVRIDGNEVMNVSNVIMDAVDPTGFQFVDLASTNLTNYFDDFYILDASTAPNDDFIGEVRIETIIPDDITSTNIDFTPLSGSNASNVDEATPDDDTSYNSSATVNDMDTHATAGLTGPTSVKDVYGVQVNTWSRKTDAADRDVAPVVLSNATTVSGPSVPVTQTYNFYFDNWETDPDTGVTWTESGVNSAEFGYEVSL